MIQTEIPINSATFSVPGEKNGMFKRLKTSLHSQMQLARHLWIPGCDICILMPPSSSWNLSLSHTAFNKVTPLSVCLHSQAWHCKGTFFKIEKESQLYGIWCNVSWFSYRTFCISTGRTNQSPTVCRQGSETSKVRWQVLTLGLNQVSGGQNEASQGRRGHSFIYIQRSWEMTLRVCAVGFVTLFADAQCEEAKSGCLIIGNAGPASLVLLRTSSPLLTYPDQWTWRSPHY